MPLSAAPVGPVIPVSDLAASRGFYESKLGLSGEETPGGWVLHAARVDALTERGVEFLHHGPEQPFETDDRGISAQEGIAVAWMRDPDGQVLTLFELR